MEAYKISSYKYGINISDLITKRLCKANCKHTVQIADKNRLETVIAEKELESFINVLSEVLLYDLAQFELADMINEFALDLDKKKVALPAAICYAEKAVIRTPVKNALRTYLHDTHSLNLEGFITFRMQDTKQIWQRCTEKTIDDMLIAEEERRLAMLLCGIFPLCESANEATLIIRSDGTCSVLCGNHTQIDYPDTTGIIGLLTMLAPEKITVCNFSGDEFQDVVCSVQKEFPGKVFVIG